MPSQLSNEREIKSQMLNFFVSKVKFPLLLFCVSADCAFYNCFFWNKMQDRSVLYAKNKNLIYYQSVLTCILEGCSNMLVYLIRLPAYLFKRFKRNQICVHIVYKICLVYQITFAYKVLHLGQKTPCIIVIPCLYD